MARAFFADTGIDPIISAVLEREGGYVDHPDDRGGPTNHGITQGTLDDVRSELDEALPEDVADLTRRQARMIYAKRYVLDPGFDQIPVPAVRAELVDTGVNMGPAPAGRMLQQALNVLNDRGRLYRDLKEDGHVGPKTLAALRAYHAARRTAGEVVLLRVLNGLQLARYVDIVRGDESQEAFMYGWIMHRIDNL
jgi:lysozyme family protein